MLPALSNCTTQLFWAIGVQQYRVLVTALANVLSCVSAACQDALRPVLPLVQKLAALEADKDKQQQTLQKLQKQQKQQQQQQQQQQKQQLSLMPPAQQQQQEAAEAIKDCLLAIGDYIESGGRPAWVVASIDAPLLWQSVRDISQHRLSGEQLARLYAGIKQQRLLQSASGGTVLAWTCMQARVHSSACLCHFDTGGGGTVVWWWWSCSCGRSRVRAAAAVQVWGSSHGGQHELHLSGILHQY
jgi:hypothetical protein